jgi:hypothetical protein
MAQELSQFQVSKEESSKVKTASALMAGRLGNKLRH